jgi:cytochrome c5
MRLVVGILLLVFSFFSYAETDNTEQEVAQRTQPIGKVHVQEEQQKQINKEIPIKKEESGQKIYERYCVVCHRDGLVDSPKFRDEQAWKSRLSGKKLEELVASAVKGLNAMPAKGTCYECTEEDIKSAIEYMLPKS